jgi:hypothetical protein
MADIGNEDNPPLDQAPPNHQNVDPETAARHGLSINVNKGTQSKAREEIFLNTTSCKYTNNS